MTKEPDVRQCPSPMGQLERIPGDRAVMLHFGGIAYCCSSFKHIILLTLEIHLGAIQ